MSGPELTAPFKAFCNLSNSTPGFPFPAILIVCANYEFGTLKIQVLNKQVKLIYKWEFHNCRLYPSCRFVALYGASVRPLAATTNLNSRFFFVLYFSKYRALPTKEVLNNKCKINHSHFMLFFMQN